MCVIVEVIEEEDDDEDVCVYEEVRIVEVTGNEVTNRLQSTG